MEQKKTTSKKEGTPGKSTVKREKAKSVNPIANLVTDFDSILKGLLAVPPIKESKKGKKR